MLVRLTGLKTGIVWDDAVELLWLRTGSVIRVDCETIVHHLGKGGGHSYIYLPSINEELLKFFDAEEAPEGMPVGNVDGSKPPLKLFCILTEGKTGNKYEILVLAETKESAIEHCIQDPAVVTQVKEQEGPFYDGYVLSTRQTHRNR